MNIATHHKQPTFTCVCTHIMPKGARAQRKRTKQIMRVLCANEMHALSLPAPADRAAAKFISSDDLATPPAHCQVATMLPAPCPQAGSSLGGSARNKNSIDSNCETPPEFSFFLLHQSAGRARRPGLSPRAIFCILPSASSQILVPLPALHIQNQLTPQLLTAIPDPD
jgi:hypothetical protein